MSPRRFASLAERLLRAGVSPRRIGVWPIVGCVLVALVGGMTNAGFEFRTAVPHGMLSAGIGFPNTRALGSIRVVATLVAILVPFLWFMLPKLRGERAPRTPPVPRQAID